MRIQRTEDSNASNAGTPVALGSLQPGHPALCIPGPVESADQVLHSMAHFAESHMSQKFADVFGETLTMLRDVFQTTDPASQPFVGAGTGTLTWDHVAANLTEPGDLALVLRTGYFGDSFADCFETYGVKVSKLTAATGERPSLPDIEAELKKKNFKVIAMTHVDTSTGVLVDVKAVSKLVHKVSPETLIVVDGVCSVGCEEVAFDDWGLDVVLTASQKGLGCPPGLYIIMASGRAIETFKNRRVPPGSYYASWAKVLPVMQSYEKKKALYFSTTPTQLVRALHTSLKTILNKPLQERFQQHHNVSLYVKKTIESWGLKQVPTKRENQANAMTAIILPDGHTPGKILPAVLRRGAVLAPGLLPEHKDIAVRFGHMGISTMNPNRDDIDRALTALQDALQEAGYKVKAAAE